jgi:RNA polymerase sigma-70 factor, ECF subfamily
VSAILDVLALNASKPKAITTVCLAKKGDKEAFVSLISESKLTLYRVAKAMLKNETDIEDAIQTTIIKAYENIGRLKNDQYFTTWVVKILINQCNEIIRSYKKTVQVENIGDADTYYDSYRDIDLQKALHSLNEDLRVVTVMFYYMDLAQAEIAKALRIPEGTVRSRLSRAREKLYNMLELQNR